MKHPPLLSSLYKNKLKIKIIKKNTKKFYCLKDLKQIFNIIIKTILILLYIKLC